ncbi:hypothetical protein [Salinicola tamaricis]|uniref:capsular polysaccharide export protein, LipB/KpsS family n=1 Tax=Salinicola tamaricis TaxID=1771309 RepID=UPI0030F37914
MVDQTRDDASITHGMADADAFTRMLEQALADHPEAEILIKTHPDVIAGRKRGYLTAAATQPRCRLMGEDINPWALMDAVKAVYVVTSQLGFEALMAGKPVHCFGVPFYAGWGLTRDAQACPRRQRQRSLEELFAAAYLRYCRYANPYTATPSTLEETLDLLADQKRQRDRLAGRWLALGFSNWKRGFVRDFLARQPRCSSATRRHRWRHSSRPATAWWCGGRNSPRRSRRCARRMAYACGAWRMASCARWGSEST